MSALGLLAVLASAPGSDKNPESRLFRLTVDACLAYLDEIAASATPADKEYLQTALRSRTQESVEKGPSVSLSSPFGGREAVPVREAAEFLYDCCDETIRRMVRSGVLEAVYTGSGRNIRVVVSSLIRLKEAMKARRGKAPVEPKT
jgi:hypothetical protein